MVLPYYFCILARLTQERHRARGRRGYGDIRICTNTQKWFLESAIGVLTFMHLYVKLYKYLQYKENTYE